MVTTNVEKLSILGVLLCILNRDFLEDAMSFDDIWDEISKSVQDSPSHGERFVYIVSWNDHFFILKVERDAYYIIDTLGERLYEGCNQAFILKFDRDTTILQLPENEDEPSLVCKGKEACKEYIKSFLAAIPIRELQVDVKKGLMASTPLHQRLQIEFHYTKSFNTQLESESPSEEPTDNSKKMWCDS